MSCIIAELFNVSKDHIKPDLSAKEPTSAPQQRPMNSQLDTTYSNKLIQFQPIMPFRESIKACLTEFC